VSEAALFVTLELLKESRQYRYRSGLTNLEVVGGCRLDLGPPKKLSCEFKSFAVLLNRFCQRPVQSLISRLQLTDTANKVFGVVGRPLSAHFVGAQNSCTTLENAKNLYVVGKYRDLHFLQLADGFPLPETVRPQTWRRTRTSRPVLLRS